MSGPLSGIRVLDLTTVVMGPYATQILGDLGADVIKIERPGGDSNRYLTPGRNRGMSGIAMTLHRNKRSIVLNLKGPHGRKALRDLVADSDVLVHNMLPGVVQSLGLEYEALSEVNPRLVYCCATGFGPNGPYFGKPAYDDLIQGASGTVSLMSAATGTPQYFPGIICDKIAGLNVVIAIQAALLSRKSTGRGQEVIVPMFESMIAFNLVEHAADAVFDPPEGEFGYARVLSKHRRPYVTKNGHICVLPYSDKDWLNFFKLIDRPELTEDARFADIAGRSANIDTLYEILGQSLTQRTTQDWLQEFEKLKIAATAISDLSEIEQDLHVQQSGFIRAALHPTQGTYRQISFPIDFSDTKSERPSPAPKLGEHSELILKDLSYTNAQIEAVANEVA